MLEFLDQPARHGSLRKLRLLQQLQTNSCKNKRLNAASASKASWSGGRDLTECRQDFVQSVVERPGVGGPVCVTETPFEGKEPGEDLRELTLKETT